MVLLDIFKTLRENELAAAIKVLNQIYSEIESVRQTNKALREKIDAMTIESEAAAAAVVVAAIVAAADELKSSHICAPVTSSNEETDDSVDVPLAVDVPVTAVAAATSVEKKKRGPRKGRKEVSI